MLHVRPLLQMLAQRICYSQEERPGKPGKKTQQRIANRYDTTKEHRAVSGWYNTQKLLERFALSQLELVRPEAPCLWTWINSWL